jgi:hypothetical protein
LSKGLWSKTRATIAALGAITGGALLTAGCLGYIAAQTQHAIITTDIDTNIVADTIIDAIQNGPSAAWSRSGEKQDMVNAAKNDLDWYNRHPRDKAPTIDHVNFIKALSGIAALGGTVLSAFGFAVQPTDNGGRDA